MLRFSKMEVVINRKLDLVCILEVKIKKYVGTVIFLSNQKLHIKLRIFFTTGKQIGNRKYFKFSPKV